MLEHWNCTVTQAGIIGDNCKTSTLSLFQPYILCLEMELQINTPTHQPRISSHCTCDTEICIYHTWWCYENVFSKWVITSAPEEDDIIMWREKHTSSHYVVYFYKPIRNVTIHRKAFTPNISTLVPHKTISKYQWKLGDIQPCNRTILCTIGSILVASQYIHYPWRERVWFK